MVPTELRCSHSWPTGVDPDSFVKSVMPKLDSAASEHAVWSEKFLDNYGPLGEELTATWECSVKTAGAIGKGTLVLSTWLPDGSRSTLLLHDVLHISALRDNLISVPKMLSVADGKEVFFSVGAKVLQQGVLVATLLTRVTTTTFILFCVPLRVRGGEAHPLGPMINAVEVICLKAALTNLPCQLAHGYNRSFHFSV